MMTFTGKIIKLTKPHYYRTWIDFGYSGSSGRFCGAMCHTILTQEFYHEREGRIPTWGYDGYSPNLLSVGILAVSLIKPQTFLNWILLIQEMHDRDRAGRYIEPQQYSLACRPVILRYYRDFTKEFTSKWGDEWTMTSDEVLAWLKSKGYQQPTKREEVVA